MSKYMIVNAETIQKRIEKLEKMSKRFYYREGIDEYDFAKEELEDVLSQSTPLIPEIEKAYEAGKLDKELSLLFDNPKGRFIANLKLDV